MLKLVGDINFTDGFFDTGFGVGSSIKKGLDPFIGLNRSEDDFWIGNFECVCANSSNKQGTHAKQFIISPQYLARVNHLNLYGVANNHVMQHGKVAYEEMLNNISAFGSDYFGSNDKRYHTFVHQGKQISIVGFNQRPENFDESPLYWAMPEYSEIASEYAKISDSDFKIAYIHWGNEFINYPYNDQRQFAHYLIDLGFDLIVGMHPHVMQGYEKYKKGHIFYSLGNCVFNMPWKPTKYAAIVNVDFENVQPKVFYEYIKLVNGCPYPIEVKDVPVEFQIKTLNKFLEKKQLPENEKYYKQVFTALSKYQKANRTTIIKDIPRLNLVDLTVMCVDFLKRKFIK